LADRFSSNYRREPRRMTTLAPVFGVFVLRTGNDTTSRPVPKRNLNQKSAFLNCVNHIVKLISPALCIHGKE
jgi:hypothetical protein